MSGFDGGGENVSRVAGRLCVFSLVVSLDGVESLASQPALTSHRNLGAAERAARGIGSNLLRLSVGKAIPEMPEPVAYCLQ